MADRADTFDVVIVGGGHNGLVAAAYLGRAGLRVAVLEARGALGGPCGTFEFMPGYRAAFTNSAGSFEPRFVDELRLGDFGLRFLPTNPTVVHPFASGTFIGWRDRVRIAEQLDAFAPGEANRYFQLLARLEELGRHLGASVFAPSPSLSAMARAVPGRLERLFERVFLGSLRQLLDEELASEEAKALLAIVALNATLAPPSAPGTAIGLMMRPLSLASTPALSPDDPRRVPLRGSSGLPLGGMGAVIDALAACCRSLGVTVRTNAPVRRVLHEGGRVTGVATRTGDEYRAPRVISAINPKTLFADLLDEAAVEDGLRQQIAAVPMRGSAFKIVLALDALPGYANLPDGVSTSDVAGVQFRIAPSLDTIERAVGEGLSGIPSHDPIMWGLIPTVTSPELAPPGRHLLSINAWHAPYALADGTWPDMRETFGWRCVDALARLMPGLKDRIVAHRFMSPNDLEEELGLVASNITHGDMLPANLFGARPHAAVHAYRTPLNGLFLSGSGVWPGGYVTGIPGFNASTAVLADIRGAVPSRTNTYKD
ncbi:MULTISPECIES: NAD(P)/FAD-dependent oxidoreductase [unclassified Chelatococcus]|uniref:phytoene desaturase family protein n=1 Tax=unclassified Chelatococcus TaxID=2638111 RepID=UPI0025C37D35|nr:NAD(P)/FAD-dependent oxidoreductase [Chelatococcus sp.]